MYAHSPTPSVSVRGLAQSYGAVKVLHALDLDIAEGEFLALLGPSGCGKSTLLNCIAGLLEPSEGQVVIKGKNVTWEEPKDRGIGMVFQSYALYPQMTVRGNLSFGLRMTGADKALIEKRVADDVKSAVARELTEAKLRRAIQDTDTVKTLREENRKLTRDLKKISDAVDALKKGGTA